MTRYPTTTKTGPKASASGTREVDGTCGGRSNRAAVSSMTRLPLWALAFALAACGDPLLDPAVVQGPRVIAAKVSVGAEPERAQPLAGEAFDVEVRVVADKEQRYDGELRACRALPTTLGVARCADEAFDVSRASGSTAAGLDFALVMNDRLRAGDSWLLFGAVCRDAPPEYSSDGHRYACRDGSSALEFSLRGEVPTASEVPNHNPDVGDELRIDGREWAPSTEARAPGVACADLDVPRVRRERAVAIRWRIDPDAVEPLEVDPNEYGANDREPLLLAHMATVAGLSRPFSSFGWDEEISDVELELRVTGERRIPTQGELALFYTVARDGRGGTDIVERAFCVLP